MAIRHPHRRGHEPFLLVFGGKTFRGQQADAAQAAAAIGAAVLQPGEALHWAALMADRCFVVPIGALAHRQVQPAVLH